MTDEEITKLREQIKSKAVELGLTLSEEKIEALVKENKMPTIKDDPLYAKIGENETAWSFIKELRKENAEKRVTLKQVQDKLKELEDAKAEAERKAAEEAGNYKDLYEKEKAKIEPLEKKAKEFDEFDKSKREAYKTQLGDKWVDSFNTIPLAELDTLATKLTDSKVEVNNSNHADKDKRDKNIPMTTEDKLKLIYKKD